MATRQNFQGPSAVGLGRPVTSPFRLMAVGQKPTKPTPVGTQQSPNHYQAQPQAQQPAPQGVAQRPQQTNQGYSGGGYRQGAPAPQGHFDQGGAWYSAQNPGPTILGRFHPANPNAPTRQIGPDQPIGGVVQPQRIPDWGDNYGQGYAPTVITQLANEDPTGYRPGWKPSGNAQESPGGLQPPNEFRLSGGLGPSAAANAQQFPALRQPPHFAGPTLPNQTRGTWQGQGPSTGVTSSALTGQSPPPTTAYQNNGSYAWDPGVLQQFMQFLNSQGFTVGADGTVYNPEGSPIANMNQPGSWGAPGAPFVNLLGGNTWENDQASTINFGQANEQAIQNNYNAWMKAQPAAQHDARLAKLMRDFGRAPQFDRTALDRVNAVQQAAIARQQGAAVQRLASQGARAGMGADQSLGAQADTANQFGIASAQLQTQNELQVYMQKYQTEMAEWQARADAVRMLFASETDAARQERLAELQAMAEQRAEQAQRRMLQYQQALADQISAKDILGAILGGGMTLGSAALGGYAGGLGGGGAASGTGLMSAAYLPDFSNVG